MSSGTVAIVVWIVAAVALFSIEAATVMFVALYFGVAALVAALAALPLCLAAVPVPAQ